MSTPLRDFITPAAARCSPLLGAAVGLLGGLVYWLAVQVWPTSVAVILSMLATALLMPHGDLAGRTFYLLVKYNVLMALSAAKLPFAAPPNTALGLIMVCGLSASQALWASAASAKPKAASQPSTLVMGTAMLLGFAPAALLGIPGLSGLVVAIVVSLSVVAYLKLERDAPRLNRFALTQPIAEVSFYLGALATWSYI